MDVSLLLRRRTNQFFLRITQPTRSTDHWQYRDGVQRDGPRLQTSHPQGQENGTGLLPYVPRDHPHGAAGLQGGAGYAGVHPVWWGEAIWSLSPDLWMG